VGPEPIWRRHSVQNGLPISRMMSMRVRPMSSSIRSSREASSARSRARRRHRRNTATTCLALSVNPSAGQWQDRERAWSDGGCTAPRGDRPADLRVGRVRARAICDDIGEPSHWCIGTRQRWVDRLLGFHVEFCSIFARNWRRVKPKAGLVDRTTVCQLRWRLRLGCSLAHMPLLTRSDFGSAVKGRFAINSV
jgi:hypothetical protein